MNFPKNQAELENDPYWKAKLDSYLAKFSAKAASRSTAREQARQPAPEADPVANLLEGVRADAPRRVQWRGGDFVIFTDEGFSRFTDSLKESAEPPAKSQRIAYVEQTVHRDAHGEMTGTTSVYHYED